MHTIFAQNVNDAYRQGLHLAAQYGKPIESRNGPVLRVSMPVTTRYEAPMERVLFDAQRKANPFFHLFEALWMIAGGHDVGLPAQFIPSFAQFSDNGTTLHGAYGYRWRHWPLHDIDGTEVDQLDLAIECLSHNLADRRVVIGMWDPARDLAYDSKDIPCNDLIKFMVTDGALDMLVFCRSNDIIFGAYGANAVHMSMLHEYMASMIGIPIGIYYQISADFHAYTEQPYTWSTYWPLTVPDSAYIDPYHREGPQVQPTPLVTDSSSFDDELAITVRAVQRKTFHTIAIEHLSNRFFVDVAQPMYAAFQYMQAREKRYCYDALALLKSRVRNPDGSLNDWLSAGIQWCDAVMEKRYGPKSKAAR